MVREMPPVQGFLDGVPKNLSTLTAGNVCVNPACPNRTFYEEKPVQCPTCGSKDFEFKEVPL